MVNPERQVEPVRLADQDLRDSLDRQENQAPQAQVGPREPKVPRDHKGREGPQEAPAQTEREAHRDNEDNLDSLMLVSLEGPELKDLDVDAVVDRQTPQRIAVFSELEDNVMIVMATPEPGYKVKMWTGTDDDTDLIQNALDSLELGDTLQLNGDFIHKREEWNLV